MKLSAQEWRLLRLPLAALGTLLVLAVLLLWALEQRSLDLQQKLSLQETQLMQARQRYQTSGQEKMTIETYLPIYSRLISEGFVGEERRIEWVDNLRNIHQQQRLFSISYDIATQSEFKPAFALNTGNFKLYHSLMKLELGLLHEGDLITLLDTLDAAQTQPFVINTCEVKRISDDTQQLFPRLSAYCELDWITVKEPQAIAGGET